MTPKLNRWPLYTVLAIYGAVVAVLAVLSARQNGGHLIYALDDTYIQLAVARNLSRNQVWGLTSQGFSGCSSSPLWVLVVAAWDRLGLPLEAAPLALNLAAGSALLGFAHHALARRGLGPSGRLVALLALCLVVSLPELSFVGMEHILHALLCVVLFDALMRAWDRPPEEDLSGLAVRILVLAPLAVAARYESLFLVAVSAAVFAVPKRRLRFGVALGAAALLPVVMYGAYAVSHGSTFLPSSVVAKSGWLGKLTLGTVVHAVLMPAAQLQKSHDVLTLAVGAALLSFWPSAEAERVRVPARVLLAVILLHASFAKLGAAYRYEGYLFAMGIFAMAAALAEQPARPTPLALGVDARARWGLVPALLAAIPFLGRAAFATMLVPAASREIYLQQTQMALFVERYYPGGSVALNDIGATAYRSDARIVDLFGLASIDVLRAKQRGTYDAARMDAITRAAGVEVIMIYDSWFGGVPQSWQRIGELRLKTSGWTAVVSDDKVAIYAADASQAPRLAQSLAEFAAELPPGATFEPRLSSPGGCLAKDGEHAAASLVAEGR